MLDLRRLLGFLHLNLFCAPPPHEPSLCYAGLMTDIESEVSPVAGARPGIAGVAWPLVTATLTMAQFLLLFTHTIFEV